MIWSLKDFGKILNVMAFISLTSCDTFVDFSDIGSNFAGPIDVKVRDEGDYFYVLNSDFEWKHNHGSILIIDEAGDKVKAMITPRLGRSLDLAGSRMIATFDEQNDTDYGTVSYYDISDPVSPKEVKTWTINCSPLKTALQATYEYFFVACSSGELYIGSFSDLNLFKRVRNYGYTRRAMFLDASAGKLIAFPTGLGVEDMAEIDKYTYESSDEKTEVRNDVPDNYEHTKRTRSQLRARSPYQYIVYDIEKEKLTGFEDTFINSTTDEKAYHESRWSYFHLLNADGTPDESGLIRDNLFRIYRTNFWEAAPDPTNPKAFYLSHRGSSGSANNVVKVTIKGDLSDTDLDGEGKCPKTYREERGRCLPLTEEVLSFERVYGFNGEVDNFQYPSDIVVKFVKGQKMLFVNHFRDLVYWAPADRKFSIVSKVLGDNTSAKQIDSNHHLSSYYAIAVNNRGVGLTVSHYGDQAFLLNVEPGKSLEIKKQLTN